MVAESKPVESTKTGVAYWSSLRIAVLALSPEQDAHGLAPCRVSELRSQQCGAGLAVGGRSSFASTSATELDGDVLSCYRIESIEKRNIEWCLGKRRTRCPMFHKTSIYPVDLLAPVRTKVDIATCGKGYLKAENAEGLQVPSLAGWRCPMSPSSPGSTRTLGGGFL